MALVAAGKTAETSPASLNAFTVWLLYAETQYPGL